ncbi:unnamed protein product [Linum tenue]|uniref:Cation/H+ exchanger domain-containing protein n=1 Tax=Linum tenue TaxID=586396 RepID=A0AAV0L896_9ROSI|nr:unnamed protein product [Linum tenue]
MARRNVSSVTMEGITSGVVNICHKELVPISLNNSVFFWKLARPRNKNDPIFGYYNAPYYSVQLAFIIFVIHILSHILKSLHLPRFSLELLAGILAGQGLRLWLPVFTVPLNSIKGLDTLGNVSLVCYAFLMGLEVDLSTLRHIGQQALYTGLSGMVLPLFIGFIQFFILAANSWYPNFFSSKFWENLAPVKLTGAIFWPVTLTVTSFSDLARILSDTKLLHTGIGKLALSSSIVSELTTWILLIIALMLNSDTLNPLYLLPIITFLIASWFFIRPAVTWVLRYAEKTDNTSLLNFLIWSGITISSIITDACGANFIIGPFVFGLIIPNENVATLIMEKFEDYVRGIFIPIFFMHNGIRTDLSSLLNPVYNTHLYTIFLLIVIAWLAKFASTFIFSKLARKTTGEAFTLGVLMNTKGVLALIVINSGRNNQGFNTLMFVVLILSVLVMSITVIPFTRAANKSKKRSNKINRRTMESNKLDSELRVLTCIHSTRNLSGMINLLEHSNANKKYPISVFALNLVQLTDRRATTMLIVHDHNNKNNFHNTFEGSGQKLSYQDEASKTILKTFESLENRGSSVSTQTLTVVSPYTTMHDDINCLGEDKQVTLILIPFHKQADVYRRLQDGNLNWRTVNKNLMATSTCSVGIIVDRGLGYKENTTTQPQVSFVVIFIGGADDREALALGWRMAKSPNVNLTILRLIPTNDLNYHNEIDCEYKEERALDEGEGEGATRMRKKDETEVDNKYVNEFRFRTMHDKNIKYIEKEVKTGEEVIRIIGRVVPSCDLYILGQRKTVASSMMMGLLEWMEFDELGVLGDTLLSSDFAEHSSLLIIKQHYMSGMPRQK